MTLSPTIFREYDIRGVVGRELDPEAAEAIARAFGTYLASAGVLFGLARAFKNREGILQALSAASTDGFSRSRRGAEAPAECRDPSIG